MGNQEPKRQSIYKGIHILEFSAKETFLSNLCNPHTTLTPCQVLWVCSNYIRMYD